MLHILSHCNVIFLTTSICKAMLTKTWDVNDRKIKISKKLNQIEKLCWITFSWYLTNATLDKHLLVGACHVIFYNTFTFFWLTVFCEIFRKVECIAYEHHWLFSNTLKTFLWINLCKNNHYFDQTQLISTPYKSCWSLSVGQD